MVKNITIKKNDLEYVKVQIRFNDECGNGKNSLGITGKYVLRGRMESCGQIQEHILDCIGESTEYDWLKLAMKFHLCDTNSPLHYIANTVYWKDNGNLENARICAISNWGKEDPLYIHDWMFNMDNDSFKAMLNARLPLLMKRFKEAIEGCGFEYNTIPVKY
jgi:hypothetical protein